MNHNSPKPYVILFLCGLFKLGGSLDIRAGLSHKVPSKPLTVVLDGQQVQLEVEDNVDESAHQFCLKHDLSQTDCLVLKNYIEKMFTSIGGNSGNEDHNIENERISPPTSKLLDNKQESKPSVAKPLVDYSHKEGPILDVNQDGIIYQVQTYLGESPPQAVRRFCTKLGLSLEHCEAVRKKFYSLHGMDEVDSSKLSEQQEPDRELTWIDPYLWNTYISPVLYALGTAVVIAVYLMQWRDEIADERVRNPD